MKILYGKVVDINDEKKLGRIRCEVFGRTENIDINHLPWYLPRRNKDAHDLPKLNEIVEIFLMDDDILMGYYKLCGNSEILEISDEDYQSAKYVLFHDLSNWNDEGILEISYTKSKGVYIELDESIVNIRRNGTIHLYSKLLNKQIDISETQISLGSVGESLEPAVMGTQNNKLHEMQANYSDYEFQSISDACMKLSNACNNPYTAPLKPIFKKLSESLKSTSIKKSNEIINFLPNLLSELVSLDKN